MAQTFTRQQLYELVWSEPIVVVAKRAGVSDVGLRKNCLALNIPVPERGYWARKRAGQAVRQAMLPERELGQADVVTVGHVTTSWDQRNIVVEQPAPLREFSENLEEVRNKARRLLGRVTVSRDLAKPHRVIARLLDEDARRAEQLKTVPYAWQQPRFHTQEGRRLLRFLNGLFLALARAGANVNIQGKDPIEWWVRVGNTSVSIEVDQYRKKTTGRAVRNDGQGKPEVHFRLVLKQIPEFPDLPHVWEDEPDNPIERRIADIATEILVAGEMGYRAWVISSHGWRVERYEEYVRQEQAKREEAERRRKEELLRRAAAKRRRLICAAKDWRLAAELRAFASAVQALLPEVPRRDEDNAIAEWVAWAMHEADQIDPLVSGLHLLVGPAETEPAA
jgi:hypothetical protein